MGCIDTVSGEEVPCLIVMLNYPIGLIWR